MEFTHKLTWKEQLEYLLSMADPGSTEQMCAALLLVDQLQGVKIRNREKRIAIAIALLFPEPTNA